MITLQGKPVTARDIENIEPEIGHRLMLAKGLDKVFVYEWDYDPLRTCFRWMLIEYDGTGEHPSASRHRVPA